MIEDQYKYTSNKISVDTNPILYINKQVIRIGGQHIRVYDSKMRLLALAHSLPFKLKEKLYIYSDEGKTNQIAYVTTHKIIDFNAAFLIKNSEDGETLGGIRRRGLVSELGQDTWLVYNQEGIEVAKLQEPSLRWSLIRKWILPFLPQTYTLSTADGKASLTIKQTWTPIILRYKVYSKNYQAFTKQINQKFLISILCTIAVIEGRE